MRQKRGRRQATAQATEDPFRVDVADSARQIGVVESGAGWPQGPVAIALAFAAAVLLTGVRALWRAFTRDPRRDD